MFINHTSKQVTAKIVYYGPGLSGKTTNLQYVFSVTNERSRGELVCIETDIERTLFFDLLPINVGQIKGYQTKFQLYTVPGQIFYDATRKMVLKGADGIVFVCDSQKLMSKSNVDSFENLADNLSEHSRKIEDIPLVFQYNKRDLSHISSIELMNKTMNKSMKYHYFSAVAIEGKGVLETLRKITSLTLVKITEAIDQSRFKISKSFSIRFDTNQEKEIIKKEDLPLKKISFHTDGEEGENISYLKEEENAATVTGPEVLNPETPNEDEPEEVMELTTAEEAKDHKSPYDTQLNIKPPKAIEIKKMPETTEPAETVEKNRKMEPPEADTEETKPGNGEEVAKPADNEPPKKAENIKQPAVEAKPRISKPDLNLELLDGLSDKSRMTILKKITPVNSSITIEIKDSKNEVIESFELDTSAQTKKLTLILDLKK